MDAPVIVATRIDHRSARVRVVKRPDGSDRVHIEYTPNGILWSEVQILAGGVDEWVHEGLQPGHTLHAYRARGSEGVLPMAGAADVGARATITATGTVQA